MRRMTAILAAALLAGCATHPLASGPKVPDDATIIEYGKGQSLSLPAKAGQIYVVDDGSGKIVWMRANASENWPNPIVDDFHHALHSDDYYSVYYVPAGDDGHR